MLYKTIKIESEKKTELIKVKNNGKYFLLGTEGGDIDIEITLANENTSFELYGIIIGKNSDTYNVNIISNHAVKNALSRVHVKAVMFDSSVFNFSGLIKIESGATLSDAYLKNDNLVIGESAVVNSTPQLEIKADDVKASHGVTISTISDNDKFYLRSRGLTDAESSDLLVAGFINEILQLGESNLDATSLLRSGTHAHVISKNN